MIIKPYGYSLWERIQEELNVLMKEIGVQNAYFPLLIPESFLKKEQDHVEGFSPELAVVTHAGGKKLEEPCVVRPTSETIIYDAFSRWIESYRDLPLIVNQWANVMRWELRPRLFLRTTEFLWQEGHTAHATAKNSDDYAIMINNTIYKKFAEEFLATPVLLGKKSENEKFAGALSTYCVEMLIQDGKSLQAGTSHDLSDHFAKSFDIKYLDKDGKEKYVHQTSWGMSTRLIGGIIMSHGDDKGIILPPNIAPIQVVITLIGGSGDKKLMSVVSELKEKLKKYNIKIDDRDLRPGEKFYEWEKKGVPLRMELGPRDVEKNMCILARRDTGEKKEYSLEEIGETVGSMLDEIQKELYKRAIKRLEETRKVVDDKDSFIKALDQGGYVYAFWCENPKCEDNIKENHKACTRCLPFDQPEENGEHKCVYCGDKTGNRRWVFSKAY